MTETDLKHFIVGESPAIRQLRREILRLAPFDGPVMICGPTGSGKELVAQALHAASGRFGRLVAVNVCAVPASVFESSMFGHVRGAFTGALHDSPGFLAESDRGTLFLDEIGSLGLPEQGKLLRGIESGEFRPVGGDREHRSSFRLVSATNEDIDDLVHQRQFRADLMYRLRGAQLFVPPLSERLEDLELLIGHFRRAAKTAATIAPDAMRLLHRHAWPGNVRELRQVIQASIALAEHGIVTGGVVRRVLRVNEPDTSTEDEERGKMLELLVSCGWDTLQVARRLGVHRVTIYRHMHRLGIRRPKKGNVLSYS
jgi:DNA-binding NtrC family response regulator